MKLPAIRPGPTRSPRRAHIGARWFRRATSWLATSLGSCSVLDGAGDVVRRVPRRIEDYGPQGIALAPDRRHAFVSVYGNPARLYEVDLATGKKRWLANAISPARAPTRRSLHTSRWARRNDIEYRAALTVRELRTGRASRIPLESEPSGGTPPENVINWSPGGRQIAVYDGRAIRLANLGAGGGSLSEPLGPQFRLAPVFLNEKTLVTLAHCCVGKQQLTSVDLDSGRRQSFATLPAPPESIVRLKPGLLLAVTALGKLTLVSRGHSKAIAEDMTAAAASLPVIADLRADARIRTGDPFITSEVLYQLSYVGGVSAF